MNGILIIDKPSGMTSHDVVDLIRRRFKIKKVGHAGTLDPIATGVLVMLLGRFTRESARLLNDEKEYVATMVVGAVSDTGDREGKIVRSEHSPSFSRARVEEVFCGFTGEISQVPPMYSAVKVRGRKMYELARRGMVVARSPRRIVIRSLEIIDCDIPRITFRVACSKGTYVRQLAADIGERLGCGAYLDSLRRIRSGDFTIAKALTLERLKGMSPRELERVLVTS